MKRIKLKLYKVLRMVGLSRDQICVTADYQKDLGLDSYDMNCLLFYLESKFNISIPEKEFSGFQTIEDTLHYLDNNIGMKKQVAA